jgi:hypothetical protein
MKLSVSGAFLLTLALATGALAAYRPRPLDARQHAAQTTELARKLTLARIEAIQQTPACRQKFEREQVDFKWLRSVLKESRFYSVAGPEGMLRFSWIVRRPADPDQSLQMLAREISADAFVLGYLDSGRYVRTKHIVLSRGYFEQDDPAAGGRRLTTIAEKQSLLLHELLHIALDRDDDDLSRREFCPLRLLTLCSTGVPQITVH